MIDDESSEPSNPESPAERLLAMAENSPEVRVRLIQRWARADTWTREEGIALAWTLYPTTVGKSEFLRKRFASALPEEARHYLELAYRSSALSGERITPSRFIEWAHATGLAFHPDWHEATERAASEIVQSRTVEANRMRQQLIRHWAGSPYWDPEEGAVLAYDLDPKGTIRRSAGGYDGPSLRASADANHLLKLAHRAIEVGALEEQSAPVDFMKWARTVGVEFHTDWWSAVKDDEAPVKEEAEESPPSPPVPELKTKERETLLKMVAVMAMAGYRWDRDAQRSEATADIASDLEKFGVPLDPDTIRKWLRKGAELIPRQDD